MTRVPRIVVLGDIAWDVVLKPERDLVPGSDVYGAVQLLPGGSAANVAVWARRLGADVVLLGKVGSDLLGHMMVQHLQTEDVARALTIVPGAATTRIGVVVLHRGERAFIMDKDNQLGFNMGDCPPGVLAGADALFVNGYAIYSSGGSAFLQEILGAARAQRIPIAFDPSSFELIRSYGPRRLMDETGPVDVLLINEQERLALGPEVELSGGRGRYAALIVEKQGPRGAAALVNGQTLHAAAPTVEAQDTTGAGDAFDGAFLVAYLAHADIERALREANDIGAYVASRVGAQPPFDPGFRAGPR